MKEWYKKQNWFVRTGIQAALWLGLFSAITYPLYRWQMKQLENSMEQRVEERVYQLQLDQIE